MLEGSNINQRTTKRRAKLAKNEEFKVPMKKSYNRASEAVTRFICELCGARFGLRLSLKFHFRIHFNQFHECPQCPSKFSRRLTLSRHIQFVHTGEQEVLERGRKDLTTINCRICDKLFESIFLCKCHESTHFQSCICKECGAKFSTAKSLRTHMNRHRNISHTCHVCGATLRSMDALRGHIRAMHDENSKIICGICQKPFRHRGTYNDHVAGHLDPSVKTCEICNITYPSRQSCFAHKKRKHPEVKLVYAMPRIDATNHKQMEMVRLLKVANDERRTKAKLSTKGGKPCHFEAGVAKVNEVSNEMFEYEGLEVLEGYEDELENVKKEEAQDEESEFTDTLQQDEDIKPEIVINEIFLEETNTSSAFCKICNSNIVIDDHTSLESHVLTHGKSKINSKCFFCPKLGSIPDLIQHLYQVHSMYLSEYHKKCSAQIENFRKETVEYACGCTQVFGSCADLEFHKMIIHEEHRPGYCKKKCGKEFFDPHRLEMHEAKCSFSHCILCGRGFTGTSALTTHMTHHDNGILSCKLCLQHFSSAAAKSQHDDQFHSNPLKCPHCSVLIRDQAKFDSHIKDHETLLHCKVCDRHFQSIQGKLQHDLVHRESKYYICAHCSREFKGKRTLLTHLEFTCKNLVQRPQSTKMLRSVADGQVDWTKVKGAPPEGVGIKGYLQMNTKKKLMCDLCGATSSNHYVAMEHARKIHGVILAQYEELWRRDHHTNKCQKCDKVFDQLSKFVIHQRTHNMQTFPCDLCGAMLKGQKALSKHRLTHEPKTQSCDICGMMFHLKEGLSMHKREKHALEAQYKCRDCDKTFRYGTHYRDHVREHKDQNFTKCQVCKKQYASRSSLRSHWHLSHPGVFGYWPSRDPAKSE